MTAKSLHLGEGNAESARDRRPRAHLHRGDDEPPQQGDTEGRLQPQGIRKGCVRMDRLRRAVPAAAARRLRHRAAAEGHEGVRRRHAGAVEHAADLHVQPGRRHDDRGLRHPERPDRQARPRLSEKLLRHRHAADAGAEGGRRRAGTLDLQARPQGHADRLQHQRQESRRAGVRTGVAGGEPAQRVLHGASQQRRGRRPAAELLPQQPDRQSARHHHCGGVAGVRRRDRALSQHPVLHGARRRLHALSGRALAARLAGPARAEEALKVSAGRDDPHVLLGHHPALQAAA